MNQRNFQGLGLFAAFLAILIVAPLSRAQETTGPIHLFVDATSTPQRILHMHEELPVHPGPLTLNYPKWIPGEHEPSGPIAELVGLKLTANGKIVPWRRDLVEMFSIHLEIPSGVSTLSMDFDFLLSAPASGFSSGTSSTASLLVLSWNQVLLYPSGPPAEKITFVPSFRLPEGWKFGTALPGAKPSGETTEFAPVALTTLVDSPVIAGKFYREVQLTPGQTPSHEIDIAADSAAALEIKPETAMHFRQLVAETGALFGSRHYRDYHFLLTLSDDVAHFGLEHHESSDDRTTERSLIDDSELIRFSGLLPHEFVHSWNGKFRRPVGLVTPDYQQPMKDDLLWVYEGLTEYLGNVLTARSGLFTAPQAREELAHYAAIYDQRPGRQWRPLQDTADAAPFLYETRKDWENWRRGTDFYEEGELLWLSVDSTLRALTKDKKSMNDFCRVFHGGEGGAPALKPYTFEDVVATLNGLAPYDWSAFLRTRLDSLAPRTPLEAVENSGWKLVFDASPNEIEVNMEIVGNFLDLSLSIGFTVSADGTLIDVIHSSPSYVAGLGPGMKIVAVNDQQFSPDAIREAISAAVSKTGPIKIIVANGALYQTFSVDYHGGMRYPHLIRDESKPDYLTEILSPQAK